MVAFILAVIIGLVGKQKGKFWKYSMMAFGIQIFVTMLMSGGGTLENPQGDGLITQALRKSTDDGPVMGIYALFVILLGWGLPLFLIYKGYEKKKIASDDVKEKELAS